MKTPIWVGVSVLAMASCGWAGGSDHSPCDLRPHPNRLARLRRSPRPILLRVSAQIPCRTHGVRARRLHRSCNSVHRTSHDGSLAKRSGHRRRSESCNHQRIWFRDTFSTRRSHQKSANRRPGLTAAAYSCCTWGVLLLRPRWRWRELP